jgi:hypothetical protein
MSFDTIVSQNKVLPSFPDWRSGENGALWFNAPLEIGGIVEPGIVLHGEARVDLPNQNVGLEILYQIPQTKKRFALIRLDWKCLSGGHRNKKRKGWPYAGKRVGETHLHPFELNWMPEKKKMRRGDLPVAIEIEGELQSFESFRASAGFFLGISNIELVKRPPWDYIGGTYGE